MPAYKDSKTGTWFVKFYCKDWTGENKQIMSIQAILAGWWNAAV